MEYSFKSNKVYVIVGAGVQGLSLAYFLLKQGAKVVLLEKNSSVGGLLGQVKIGDKLYLDRFYHHYFLKDKYFLALVKELGLQEYLHKEAFTSSYGSLTSSVKELVLLGSLLAIPFAGLTKNIKFGTIKKLFGLKYSKGLGELVYKKFGKDSDNVSVSWLWARLHARYSLFSAFKAGLLKQEQLYFFDVSAKRLLDTLVQNIVKMGGVIETNIDVKDMKQVLDVCKKHDIIVSDIADNTRKNQQEYHIDSVIFTIPLPESVKVLNKAKQQNLLDVNAKNWVDTVKIPKYTASYNALIVLDKKYCQSRVNGQIIKSEQTNKIGQTNKTDQVGRKNQASKNEAYWQHVSPEYYPFIVKVAHHVSNKLDTCVYYLGAYLEDLDMVDKAQAVLEANLCKMLGIAEKTGPNCKKYIKNTYISVAKYASHVPTVEYVNNIPNKQVGFMHFGDFDKKDKDSKVFNTKIIVSSFAQLFPWDRGVNYAIYQAKEVFGELNK